MSEKIYKMITDRIIARMEEGKLPWRKLWRVGESCSKNGSPTWNAVNPRGYRGINMILTACQGYPSGAWVSFKQAKELGGHVKKGEKGTQIVFWKFLEVEDKETGKKKSIPFLRYSTVFNVTQCEGLPEHIMQQGQPEPGEAHERVEPIEACEEIVRGYLENDGPSLGHGGSSAHYRPSADHVQMPSRDTFESPEAYYDVLFHELGHSTGAKKRLDRCLTGHIDEKAYAREELVAELTSAFLGNDAGISTEDLEKNNAAYLQSWVKRLKNDPKAIIWAAGRADKAARWIRGEREEKASEEVA